MRIVSRDGRIDYEVVLRALGQRLEKEHVNSFAVQIEGKNVFVSGEADSSRAKSLRWGDKSDLDRTIFQRSVKPDDLRERDRYHSGRRMFRDCYSLEDIYRLDKEGKAKRKDPDRIPNGQSVSQVLRVMGAYVSRKEAKLYSVALREGNIEIAYETDAGRQVKDIFRWPTKD